MSTSAKPKKYIFVNGVMQKNPAYDASSHQHRPANYQHHNDELAVISNSSDLREAQALQQTLEKVDVEIKYVSSTVAAMDQFQSTTHQQQFMPAEVTDEAGATTQQNPLARDLLQELFDYFVIYVRLVSAWLVLVLVLLSSTCVFLCAHSLTHSLNN
jgi:hypothetical protein